jgi:hypothetical protein
VEQITRIAFDYSLDEAVDANTRFMRGSAAGQAARRRSIWSTGATLAALLFIVAALRMRDPDAGTMLPVVLLALVAGGLAAAIHAFVYDWTIRRRVRRFLTDHVHDADALHCEIELRPDGAWVKQPYAEMLFPWHDASAVHDAGDGIELHFRMGFVLARNRAFATAEDRAAFLARARTLAAEATNTSS